MTGSIVFAYGISQDASMENNVLFYVRGGKLLISGFAVSVFVNISATGLTGKHSSSAKESRCLTQAFTTYLAGRIWWANRESRIHLGISMDTKLQHIMRIMFVVPHSINSTLPILTVTVSFSALNPDCCIQQ